MKSLNNNFNKNIQILKINLERGLKIEEANHIIDTWYKAFNKAGLYGPEEEAFINEANQALSDYIFKKTGLKYVKAN